MVWSFLPFSNCCFDLKLVASDNGSVLLGESMVRLIVLVCLMSWSSLFASELRSYQVIGLEKNYFITLKHFPKKGLALDRRCFSSNSSCQLDKLIEKLRSFELDPGLLIGGKNPGSILCTQALKGSIVMVEDNKSLHRLSLCLSKSGHFFSNSTLYFIYETQGKIQWDS
jgi:hypothetical protein